jgi:hypothetical protein
MKYVKEIYLTFDFKENISEDEFDIPFDYSEDILNIQKLKSHPRELKSIAKSLLVIGQITEMEYDEMINDNMKILNSNIVETYESCNKLSHKVNKLSSTTSITNPEHEFYKEEVERLMESLKGINAFTEFKKKILTYMPYIRYIKTDALFESLSIESDEYYKRSLLASNIDLFKSRKHKYEYFFEYFFEFIFGTPTEEQFQIYKKIISNYDDDVLKKNIYQKEITTSTSTGSRFILVKADLHGGNMVSINNIVKKKYQKMITASTGRFKLVKANLHGGDMFDVSTAVTTIQHFMMGKGKSSVLTPLLTMYFVLKHGKNVYIIIPEHLKKQTLKTMEPYVKIFSMDTVKIVTNIEYN